MNDLKTIYVYLEDEGTDVWRPVEAQDLGASKFRIVSVNADPEDEHWRFATGDIVRCESKKLSSGMCLVAVEKEDERTAEQQGGGYSPPAKVGYCPGKCMGVTLCRKYADFLES